MTHDPLCPMTAEKIICCCALINYVRKDERMRDDDYAYVATQSYAAALRDAVEAVKALPPNGIGVAADAWLWESALGQEVIAAIGALGGER